MMEFRKAVPQDLDQIMRIVEQARALFRESGIPQWQNGYPNAQSIQQDIDNGWSWVLCAQGKVCAIAAIVLQPDPNYAEIEGKWLWDGPYAAIHRVAVDGSFKKQGLASRMVEEAAALASKMGRGSLRCDTHEVNRPMRGMLEKNGFQLCGKIYLLDDNHAPRVVYERLL